MKTEDCRNFDNDLEIITTRNLEEIESIRPIWEEMQSNEPYPVINADIERYISVIKASKDAAQPYVMVFKRNGYPEAMVIGRVRKQSLEVTFGYKTLLRPSLNFLSIISGGIIGQPQSDFYALLIHELMRVLRHGEVDMILFNHLRTDSPTYQLARSMPSFLCKGHFPKIEKHCCMSVPENINLFYQARSKKHRANFRRYTRKLEKEYSNQIKVITYRHEDELNDAIKAASRISCNTYQWGLGCRFVDDSQTRVMLTTAARLGWLRMSVLYIADEPSAFQIGLNYRKKYFLEQIGFDPKWAKFDVGTILFLKVLEDICADSDIEFINFGFGDAAYKRRFSDKQWQDSSVFIFAPRLYPIFINILRSTIIGLSLVLEYVFDKIGCTNWIKRRWRNLLKRNN